MNDYVVSVVVQNPYGKEYEVVANTNVSYTKPSPSSWESDVDYYGGYDIDIDWDTAMVLDLDDIECAEAVSLEDILPDIKLDYEDLHEKLEAAAIEMYEKSLEQAAIDNYILDSYFDY